MDFVFFEAAVAAGMLVGCLLAIEIGRRFGDRFPGGHTDGSKSFGTLQGAVFGLMGLLLAFSLNGALQRFDERRSIILQEYNALTTAVDRVDLLGEPAAAELKRLLKAYTASRIALYESPPEGFWSDDLLTRQRALNNGLKRSVDLAWARLTTECSISKNSNACQIVVASIGAVFDQARTQLASSDRHPPTIVYLLLVFFALLSSFLAGLDLGPRSGRTRIYAITFSLSLSLSLLVITDLEFPRAGWVRLDGFESLLKLIAERPD